MPDDAAAIASALDRGDPAAALPIALMAWRRDRSVVLAELVDAIAAKLPAPAIRGRDKEAFQRGYLALLRDPAAVTSLASGLTQRVPIRATDYFAKDRDRKKHASFLARVRALGTLPADPRISGALARVIEAPPFTVEHCEAVYQPVIDLAVAHGDARVLAVFERVVEGPTAKTKTMRDYLAKALPKAVETLSAHRNVTTPAFDRLVTRLRGPAVAPVPAAIDDLLAECLANPDDDAPRLVYADALLEQGDPRGEFIQLQLRPEPLPEADAKRVASLQRKHEKAWLGDIARVTKLRVFRKGFLDKCELLQGAAAEPAMWKAIAADPRMATVRTLDKGSASEALYRSFVFSPALRSLRRVTVPSNVMLAALPEAARPIEAVELSSFAQATLGILDRVGPSAGIKSLTFPTTDSPAQLLEHVGRWAGRARFDELVAAPHHRAGDAWAEDDLTWLFAFERLGVRRLGISLGVYDNRLVLTRTKTGVTAEIVANQDALVVRLLTRKLPLKLEHTVIRGSPAIWFPPGPVAVKAIKKARAELRERWRSELGGGRGE